MKATLLICFKGLFKHLLCYGLFIVPYVIAIPANSQPYKNLVMEGAGVRGIAYVGALKELERRAILTNIDKVGGTSAGAIVALCVSLGYSSIEIEKIIYELRINRFNDGKFLFVGGMVRLNRNFGWYNGDRFTNWVEEIIECRTENAEITFLELHQRGFKDLYVTGTSLNQQRLIIFSYETYPEMKVKDAVRISMSIPLYFEAVSIDSVGHVLGRESRAENNVDIMVDGGITANYPIFLFDSLTTSDGATKRIPNTQTLGLRIDTPEQIDFDSNQKCLAPISITTFRSYLNAFYAYVIENLNRKDLTGSDWQRTISISCGNVSPKVKRLSLATKNLLIRNGEDAAKQFFETLPETVR
jgi:NTE family protein